MPFATTVLSVSSSSPQSRSSKASSTPYSVSVNRVSTASEKSGTARRTQNGQRQQSGASPSPANIMRRQHDNSTRSVDEHYIGSCAVFNTEVDDDKLGDNQPISKGSELCAAYALEPGQHPAYTDVKCRYNRPNHFEHPRLFRYPDAFFVIAEKQQNYICICR